MYPCASPSLGEPGEGILHLFPACLEEVCQFVNEEDEVREGGRGAIAAFHLGDQAGKGHGSFLDICDRWAEEVGEGGEGGEASFFGVNEDELEFALAVEEG